MHTHVSLMKKLFVIFCLISLSNITFAAVNVCVDQTGKKVFSDATCEKRGLQKAKADFPITSKDAALPVFVVPNPEASSPGSIDALKSNATGMSEKRASPWSSDRPLRGIAWFLISLMPIAAILFLSFHLVMFIKARLRKYRHVRSAMEKIG